MATIVAKNNRMSMSGGDLVADYIEAVSADDCSEVDKIKTPFAQIIVCGTAEKPYFNIAYFDADGSGHIGWGSYYLEYVFKWLEENFEITEEPLAVDLGPVVRCKDCKRREIDSVCEYFDENDFCSRGERREEDG